ncbi:MAG: VWA domain-containing protein [Polyangiaceae bacterium]
MKNLGRAVASACVLALFGCGDDSASGAGGSTGGGSSQAGGGAGGGSSSCQSADQCPAGAVCDPETNQCAENKPCATHTECGANAACLDGVCGLNTSGGPCDSDTNCLSGETCTGGVCGCGGVVYGAESVPPNVLIVLDRSGSMNDMIPGGTKWDVARAAINQVISSYGSGVQFGLMLYPGTDLAGNQGMQCGPGAVFVDPAPATGPTISSDLAMANTTSFGTPTAEALTALVGYAPLLDPNRDNFILLITDGQSTCADPVPVVTSIFGQAPSVKTFVVGFGSAVDPTELDAMAQAGGTAGPMMPYYFQADDATALNTAFATIAGSVLSCSYALSDVPPDPSQLYVWIDGVNVPADPANGWTYDATLNQITFVGATCADLQSGAAMELVVSYGCPAPPPPQ